ncbi:hypothetical protein [Streptomyces sp. KS_5]|uniref:hypothetical protein n=1 Tax=Streptomyces sp. KS_5 TaxID=1881018 RepID=UPI00089A7096|nr:hypothetical protein [Streptomyces sp. KS_5]SEC35721.1 hypothetical protein SAMN05428938_1861 [Streptomyces sp. KS_5]
MTLVITLVTPHGVWASTDHRLTAHPDGSVITDSSVKHVIIRCPDGSALVSYTGLGRVGQLDVSNWMREVLRGETRSVNESLIDLREQATARIGSQAKSLDIRHAFLAGAFLNERPWAVAITNATPPTGSSPGSIKSTFETSAMLAERSVVFAEGSGRDAIVQADRELLHRVSDRKPRRPEDFMRLLGDVSRRAAESGHPGARLVSRSCSVVFMPPSGDDVKQEWYGPEEERALAPAGFSHMLFGIDLGEMARPMIELSQALWNGDITEEDFNLRTEEAAKKAVQPRNRRNPAAKER